MKRLQIANYIVFALLMISILLGYQFLWGLLFLYWTVIGISSGQAFLLTDVFRATEPVLFWCIQVAWIVLGLFLLLGDVFPSLA